MTGIEFFIIFSVTALYFAVVPWRKRFDLFVADTELRQCFLKEGKRFFLAVAHLVCEFKTVIRLDTFDRIGKFLNYMLEKLRRRIGTFLLEGFQIPKPAVFIDESVLIELFFRCFSH